MKLNKSLMTLTASCLACTLSAGAVFAHDPVVKDFYKTIEECSGKSELQGGLEGAAIGALLGDAIGDRDSAKAFGIFGLIVGANEASGKTCTTKSVYDYSTVTFTDNGKSYTVAFKKQ